MNLEGRWCWLYNILFDLKILRMDVEEGPHGREDDGTYVFNLIMEPRWFWEKKRNNGNLV